MNICDCCGQENNVGAKFCGGCGATLGGNQAAMNPHKIKKGLWIGIVISVGIIATIVIGFLFFFHSQNPLIATWEEIGGGENMTFKQDGSIQVEGSEDVKFNYKIQGNELSIYQNGELSNVGNYSINNDVLTIKAENGENQFKKIK